MDIRRIALCYLILRRLRRRKFRASYVRKINFDEAMKGCQRFRLFYDVYRNENELKMFCRLSRDQFDKLHDRIKLRIRHKLTHVRPVSSKIRLAIFLR